MTIARSAADRTPEQWRSHVAEVLTRSRNRSQSLIDVVDDDDLLRQHSPLMSPLIWDFAHIGNQEELWLVRDVGGRAPVRQDIDELYDAFKHARTDRPTLPLLGPAEARHYVREVRDKAFDVLDHSPLEGRPLLERAFAFGMIAQHEQQHSETMLATHQLRVGASVLDASPPPAGTRLAASEVLVPGGPFTMGTSTEPWALDNERPAHVVDLPPYFIDTAAVTNGAFMAFVDTGGYDEPRWWSAQGWAHRLKSRLSAPLFWERDGGEWWRLRFGVRELVPPHEPVMHVSFHEAAAYAAWAGKRLPTESEWERPRGGIPPVAGHGDTHGATRTRGPNTRTSVSATFAQPGPAPTPAEPHRLACTNSSAMSGSGPRATSAATRALPPFPTTNTPWSSSASTTRCCGVVRSAQMPSL